jgi:hypothetical protein
MTPSAALETIADIYDLKPGMIGEIAPETLIASRRPPTPLKEKE